MNKIIVLSLFPQMILEALSYGINKRAESQIPIESLNLRTWGLGENLRVDSPCVAHGPGMLFRADVVADAINSVKKNHPNAYVVHMSPRGNSLNTKKIDELTSQSELIILASRYEGLDQRIIDYYIDEEISIGDYVLSGGELPAIILVDSLLRTHEHVLRSDAVADESFQQGLLEYHHYTKPFNFENKTIPEYLLSGNHKVINEKRFNQQLYETWAKRIDLIREYPLCRVDVPQTNPLTKIKKENKILQKRLKAFEKVIRENRDVRRFEKHS